MRSWAVARPCSLTVRRLLLRSPGADLAPGRDGRLEPRSCSRAAPSRTYEHTATFVLRPSADLPDQQIPDAVRGIAQQDAQLVRTISRVIETDRFVDQAFLVGAARESRMGLLRADGVDRAGQRRDRGGPARSRRGSPRRRAGEAFTDEASDWVSAVYRAYTLELLEIEATEGSVSASPAQSIVLATLLGFLLGLGVVFAESKARERRGLELAEPARAPAPRMPRQERSSRAKPRVVVRRSRAHVACPSARPSQKPLQRPLPLAQRRPRPDDETSAARPDR